MIVIHEEIISQRSDADYERLSTNDNGTWLTYKITRSEAGYHYGFEFDISNDGHSFSVSVDDPDDNSTAITIPRDRMFEVHAWLTEQLYGEG